MIDIRQVETAQQAFDLLSDGEPKIISRYGAPELIRRAGLVKAGAFDFDGTLITKAQWDEVAKLMPEDLRRRDREFIEWYLEHRTDQDLPDTTLDDPDWFHSHLLDSNRTAAEGGSVAQFAHFCERSGITLGNLIETGMELPPRDGAIELLKLFVLYVIISYGIEHVIQGFAKAHGLDPHIVASRFKFREPDMLVMGHEYNVVVSSTKPLAANRFRTLTGIADEEMLVVGDSVVDVEMMHPGGLNILVMPCKEANKKLTAFRNGNLAGMWPKLTAILYSDSLMPLVELIELGRSRS